MTGHESVGSLTDSFRKRFEEKIYEEFNEMIDEYNQIMNSDEIKKGIFEYKTKLIDDERFDIKTKKRFFSDIDSQLSIIEI